MGRECGDCFYCHLNRGDWYCNKKRKSISCLDRACGDFVSEEKQSCSDCAFADLYTGLFAGNDTYICTRTNKKVKGSDVQCSKFVQG